jgi:outer membrane protein TolC
LRIKIYVLQRGTARTLNVFSPSRPATLAALLLIGPLCAHAQISFTSAVDLALRNSPRVRSAQAQVDRTRAEVSESRDVYIPSVSAGADYGEAIGYSPYPPTLFSVTASSLVFNFAQKDYIRSARAGLSAAQFALQDVRETVAEDAALAFVAVDHDQQQVQALTQQLGYANHLVEIVQQRAGAGYDTAIDLTQAKLTAAQLNLNLIHMQSQLDTDRTHLASLVGMPASAVNVQGGFPDQAFPSMDSADTVNVRSPAVSAAFASAKAKQEQAFGDNRFLFRPQINLIVQYNHYATFTDAFQQLKLVYRNISNDDQVYAVQINIPLFDRARSARARETAADAVRVYNDARNTQRQIFDAQARLHNSLAELQARSTVATLDQQLAQQQLDAVRVQISAPIANSPPTTPKEVQTALINERAKYLAVIDSTFQLRQSEISILRQTGRLEQWVRSLDAGPSNALPAAPAVGLPKP